MKRLCNYCKQEVVEFIYSLYKHKDRDSKCKKSDFTNLLSKNETHKVK